MSGLTSDDRHAIAVVHDAIASGHPLATFRPLRDAVGFVSSRAKIAVALGGNRSGKTETGAYKMARDSLGLDDDRFVNREELVIAQTWDHIGLINYPKLAKYIEGCVSRVSWHDSGKGQPHTVVVNNIHGGQTHIRFLTTEAGITKFSGQAYHGVWIDEQCVTESVFYEIIRGLADYSGRLWWTLTPIMPDAFLEQRYTSEKEGWEFHHFDLECNRKSRGGYLDDGDIDQLIEEIPPDWRDVRVRGHFAGFLGAVYPQVRRDVHVIPPFEVPKHWRKFIGIDFGYNNPTAIVWMARDTEGRWYVVREHYEAKRTMDWHADMMRKVSPWPLEDCRIYADPEGAQSRADLASYGIHTLAANKEARSVMRGIELVSGLLHKTSPAKDGRNLPMLVFFDCCPIAFREHKSYRWAARPRQDTRDPRDRPVDKDDHTCDAVRYPIYSEAHSGIEIPNVEIKALISNRSPARLVTNNRYYGEPYKRRRW